MNLVVNTIQKKINNPVVEAILGAFGNNRNTDRFLSIPPAAELPLSGRLGGEAALVELDKYIPRLAQSAPKEPAIMTNTVPSQLRK